MSERRDRFDQLGLESVIRARFPAGDGWQVPAELEQLVVAAGLEESRRVAGAEGGRASMTERQFRDTLASIREEYYDDFLRRLADWAGRQVGLGPLDDPRGRT